MEQISSWRGFDRNNLLLNANAQAESVLAETVELEGARFLFEVGHKDAATFFCDKIGDKGMELRKEFLHL